MSLQQKSRFIKVTKLFTTAVFVCLLFFNFKLSLSDEKTEGINLLGLNLSTFVSDTFATGNTLCRACLPKNGVVCFMDRIWFVDYMEYFWPDC